MKHILLLLFTCMLLHSVHAQPGYTLVPLEFQLFTADWKMALSNQQHYQVQWRNASDGQHNWQKAIVKQGSFFTDRLRSDGPPTDLKIYREGGNDTMYITCQKSLRHIPFIPGHFVLDASQTYLANMETLNGVRITNKSWESFRKERITEKKMLLKKRYWYISKSVAYSDNNTPDIVEAGFTKSIHLKETKDGEIKEYISLGKLYFAPNLSPAVYCIGFLADDDDEDEKFSTYLLESLDGCRSWQIKFPLPENTISMVNMNAGSFDFAISYPDNSLYSFSTTGVLLSKTIMNDLPCHWPNAPFSSCEDRGEKKWTEEFQVSDPYMDAGSYRHHYHTLFRSSDENKKIRLDSMPYNPSLLSVSYDEGMHWDPILRFHSKETYAYVTQRKNKLVLLSYHYTLVSNDFGKNWTFYANGSFEGGAWNFIWLDDRTLVNVTSHYADVMEIE